MEELKKLENHYLKLIEEKDKEYVSLEGELDDWGAKYNGIKFSSELEISKLTKELLQAKELLKESQKWILLLKGTEYSKKFINEIKEFLKK